MAKARRRTIRSATKRSASRPAAKRARAGAKDAIALLKADHREVEGLFGQFKKARSNDRKLELATRICMALKVHTAIEEEIFYPAFLEATSDQDKHHEAEIEHDGAMKLIGQIEASGPDDEYYDSKVKVLSEMIRHHVNEEEKRGGMFTEARAAKMDLADLGERLKERKHQLMSGAAKSRRNGDFLAPMIGA